MTGKIYGTSFPKLKVGHIVTGPFEQIGSFFPATAPIEFGALLKYTANRKEYEVMDGTETDAALFAGIALVEVAATPHKYPGTKTRYEVREAGNVLVVGHTAVLFGGDTAALAGIREGGKVYLSATGVTTVEADNLLIPNLVFTGIIENDGENNIVGVRKLY